VKYNQKNHSQTAHLLFGEIDTTKLGRQTVTQSAITMFAQASRFLIQLLSTVALARLLIPSDFGLLAMATVLVNFVSIIKDFGLSQATVQRRQISSQQISSLFWINVGISTGLALLIALSGPLIAWVYDETRLTLVVISLSVPIVISGFGLQHRALLQRNMRFTELAIIDTSALALGVLAGIFSAWIGLGLWALVIMQVVNSMIATALVVIRVNWVPQFRYPDSESMEMLRFGLNLSLSNLLNYLSRNTDTFLIGRYLGADALGQYSRAYALLIAPISQLTAPLSIVFLPALSRLKEEPKRFSELYLSLVRWVNLLTAPSAVLLAFFGSNLTVLLLGKNWHEAGDIFEVLAITAIFQPLGNLCGLMLVALGQTDRILKWTLFSSVLIVGSFFAGISFGAIGVAAFYSFAILVQQPILTWFTLKKSPVSLEKYLHALAPGILVAILVLCLIYGLNLRES
tara:strand:+ start:1211 stop:2584 length:1374 start_codon:yes stop_codon:yes gene_type:complete